MAFGRNVNRTLGRGIQVSADGSPEWKLGGITIDWSGVSAVSGSDETLDDGTIVRVGEKYLRYGTVLSRSSSPGDYAVAAAGTLNNGETVILNETVILDLDGNVNSDNRGAIEGGRVWEDRILMGGSGEPTKAQVLAALPRLQLVVD